MRRKRIANKMTTKKKTILVILILGALIIVFLPQHISLDLTGSKVQSGTLKVDTSFVEESEIELFVPTFLGNDQRRYYGKGIPQGLELIKKFKLGCGKSYNGKQYEKWCGAGWTGQPTIIKDSGKIYLIIGAFDYYLRKISLDTFEEVWRYKYDDIIKGSSTIYIDEKANEENKIVILQGSRKGFYNRVYSQNIVPSFRAISFRTGKELWKLNIKRTNSYSRDNDSSPILIEDTLLFNAGENSIGYFLSGDLSDTVNEDGLIQPRIISEIQLYSDDDRRKHGGNLVTEASPGRLGDTIYIASGSRSYLWNKYPYTKDCLGFLYRF